MRVSSLLLGMVVLSAVVMLAGSSYARIAPESIAGMWLLDEGRGDKVEDSSGNENDGTISGAEWVDGKLGKALSFDGVNDRVVIPDADSLDLPEAWTITAWVFVNKSENGFGHIVGKRSGPLSNYAFRTSGNGTLWQSYFWKGSWHVANSQGTVKKDTWLYMTAVYDGSSTIRFYENGVDIGSANVGPPPPVDEVDVNLGGWHNNTTELLDGILDEVAILNVALEEEDIQSIMNMGLERAIGLTSVSSKDKLTTTWARTKAQN